MSLAIAGSAVFSNMNQCDQDAVILELTCCTASYVAWNLSFLIVWQVP